MTEQDYFAELHRLRQLEESENDKAAECRLESLYGIKPVRLQWYIEKARYEWKIKGAVQEAFHILADKGWHIAPYPGIKELTQLYMDLVSSYQDIQDMQRHKLLYLGICGSPTKEDENWLVEINEQFCRSKSDFLKNTESETEIYNLLGFYFMFHNNVMFFLLSAYMRKTNTAFPAGREWFLQFVNSGFLSENLAVESKTSFIIVEDETSDGLDEEIACYILQQFQKQIYRIKPPIPLEVPHEVDLKDTAAIGLDAMSVSDNVHTIYPATIICKGEELGDNREYLLNVLIRDELKDKFAVVLTSGILMDNLCCQTVLKKNLERLYNFMSPALESQMVFGWTGDYLAYISQIHDTDAAVLLNTPSETAYSIIVPARNSSSTLRYTLMTCLNQRYKGKYEIVLSDNSTPGNTEVYQLYKEIDDPRIKYYRTPREYNLSRSFEFAFLHTKGEFLLSLGSDDALLPWALEVLDDIRTRYPDEDIIQWERGFYAWPGFNGGQQNQFVIPRKYRKGEFCLKYVDQQNYLASILSDSDKMYLLPNLYLNSGCKRDYLKTILSKTGRLFDGICQDIYMGIVNVSINKKILNICYPLAIAGMAGESMGARANRVYALKEEEKEFLNDLKKTANLGGYCASPYERLMPEVTTDKSSLYNCILRMIARGNIAESDLEYIDFRKWFLELYTYLDIRDPLYDKKLHYFRYTASLHGGEFLKWFDETIYRNAWKPRLLNEEKLAGRRKKKSYTEGQNPFGGQTLDASRYHVRNIYEAAVLFEKLSGL